MSQTIEKKCPVCGRMYKRQYCEFCKRESLWNRQESLQIFTPRIKKILTENEIKINPKDIQHLNDGGSLLITGVLGVGKTVYGAGVLLESMRLAYIEQLSLGEYHFVKESELLQNIRDSFDRTQSFSMDFLYRDVVMLDDLGVEKITDWVLDVLYRIIDYRYEYRLPTIFTTNLDGEQLADRLGDRIPDRLEEICRVVKIKGKSKRKKQRH